MSKRNWSSYCPVTADLNRYLDDCDAAEARAEQEEREEQEWFDWHGPQECACQGKGWAGCSCEVGEEWKEEEDAEQASWDAQEAIEALNAWSAEADGKPKGADWRGVEVRIHHPWD